MLNMHPTHHSSTSILYKQRRSSSLLFNPTLNDGEVTFNEQISSMVSFGRFVASCVLRRLYASKLQCKTTTISCSISGLKGYSSSKSNALCSIECRNLVGRSIDLQNPQPAESIRMPDPVGTGSSFGRSRRKHKTHIETIQSTKSVLGNYQIVATAISFHFGGPSTIDSVQ